MANTIIKEPLDKEKISKLISLFFDLRKEYENFRKNASVMESPLQYIARRIEEDLKRRGYE